MQNLTIRLATLKDLDVLLAFEQELIISERPFDETIKPAPVSYYDLKEYVQREDVAVVVAESEGRVISSGYALAKRAREYLDHDEYAYLGFMYTVPEYRGKGVNAEIVAYLKNWARDRGLREIRLTVYSDNLPAIRAYEKAGFKSHLVEMRIPSQ